MSDDFAIRVENLTKTYKLYNSPIDRLKESLHPFRKRYHHDFYALHEVSFDLERGETMGIIGKNGSGKSTLLKLITGVLAPTNGNILVNGKISALLELGAGFNPELTGIANIFFNGTLMGYTHGQIESKLDHILSFADIGEFINQPVKSYSSGMFVRLAFAVAINVDPDILIIDESLSVGDMLFNSKCMSAINRFRENGVSILFVTHDINAVKSLCSRTIYLKEGRLAEIGSSGSITDKYIRETREESQQLLGENAFSKIVFDADDYIHASDLAHQPLELTDKEFERRAALFRYGSGEVKVKNAKLLNKNGEVVSRLNYDDVVIITINLECERESTFSVNYMIRDDKNINLLGSNLKFENMELISGGPGDKYVVQFETHTPLSAGNYNILLSITSPVIANKSAKFIDVIENAIVFEVLERSKSRLWTKMYVQNKVTITHDGNVKNEISNQ